jgi:hypothetical protein
MGWFPDVLRLLCIGGFIFCDSCRMPHQQQDHNGVEILVSVCGMAAAAPQHGARSVL